MSEDKPKRFRFSLRFLLAWVLLTSLLSWFSLNRIETKNHDLSITMGNSSSIYIVQLQFQGWPFPVYIGHRDSHDPDYFNDTPIAKTPTVQLYKNREFLPWALVANLALCGAVSLAVCAFGKLSTRRFFSASSGGEE